MNYIIFYTFNGIAFVMFHLMAVNILVWQKLWPLLVVLTFTTSIAFQQFYLLVKMRFQSKK